MSELHDVISTRLAELHVGAPFSAIHKDEAVPLLTDYFVRRIPDEWNAPPPPELVDGRQLVPLFVGCDSYAIYCVDDHTREIVEIDPEAPWPPTNLYPNWDSFLVGLYSTMSADKTDSEKETLRELLGVALEVDE